MQKACTKCQTLFECGANSPEQNCWCNELPKITPTDNSDCLCPVCLAQKIKELQKPDDAPAKPHG